MATRILPTFSGLYHYEYRIDLDRNNTLYRLAFHFVPGDRQAGAGVGAWYVDLHDAADVPLVRGVRLSLGRDKWKPYRYRAGMPAAKLNVVDSTGLGQEPGKDDLGARVLLEIDLEA